MAEFTKQDAEQAQQIVATLLRGPREGRPDYGSLVISDLEFDADDFRADIEILAAIGEPCPALRFGDRLFPVALSLLMGPSWLRWGPGRRWVLERYYAEVLYYALRSGPESGVWIPGLERMPLEQAEMVFSSAATDFLATRIAATRRNELGSARPTLSMFTRRLGGTRVQTPGCNFSVSTNSPGLRVFWSGAYRISANYFGHPTTPTTSVLQAGTYVFGVDGGAYGNAVQWDTSAVVSLPGIPQVHLNF